MPQAILIVELLLRYGPAVAKAAKDIMSMKDPTQADWDNLWALADKDYNTLREEARKRSSL
jgi:hypothetical protein